MKRPAHYVELPLYAYFEVLAYKDKLYKRDDLISAHNDHIPARSSIILRKAIYLQRISYDE